jgi:hypothetical protein
VPLFHATDSCFEEGLDDGVSGTSMGYYRVYRLRH